MKWYRAIESKRLKINMEKTKMMVNHSSGDVLVQSGRWSGSGVETDFILYTPCGKWYHKGCSGIRRSTVQVMDLLKRCCIYV